MTVRPLAAVAIASIIVCGKVSYAGTLELPAAMTLGNGSQRVDFLPSLPITGRGVLSLRWTDSAGRLIVEDSRPVDPGAGDRIPFALDLRRAVPALNYLVASLTVDCSGAACQPEKSRDTAEATFVTLAPPANWWDYQIIMWQPQSPAAFATLRRQGVTAGKLFAKEQALDVKGGEAASLLASGLGWYDENIATDFYAPYHRFFPDKAVNWRYLALQAQHRKDPESLGPFMRRPSLADPAWRKDVGLRLRNVAMAQKGLRPLYYSLGDETGIADLAAYWDFDFSPVSLEAFRHWLERRDGSLEGLNRQWDRDFREWRDVMPLTAAQAIARPGENFSAWADFRQWMDISFADTLREGRDALHAGDPAALAAIEGGQVPGWGGYDYALLATVVDAFELYDFGNNIELARSFRPEAPVLTSSGGSDQVERLRIWRQALRGASGLILWDEKGEFAGADGTSGPRGKAMAGQFAELRGGLAALLMNSPAGPAPVAIHYSPASFRTAWMIDQKRQRGAGLEATTNADHQPDDFTVLRESLCDLLADLGIAYRFISSQTLEAGEIGGARVLILPRSLSLSADEAEGLRRFIDQGGRVLALDRPGGFDEHGRKRTEPLLPDLAVQAAGALMPYHAHPRALGSNQVRRQFADKLRAAGAVPAVRLIDEKTGREAPGIAITQRRNGAMTILGLLNTDAQAMAMPRSRSILIRLPETRAVTDLRSGREYGETDTVKVTLPAYEPVILSLSPVAPPDFSIEVPPSLRLGQTATLAVGRAGTSPDAVQVFHLEVRNPDGVLMDQYCANLRANSGTVKRLLPLALNDPPGRWSLSVRDTVSGRQKISVVTVER